MDKTGEKIKVIIADDHTVVREGLRRILALDPTIEVAGEARNGREAISQAIALLPDVVIMDLKMPVMDGISAIRELKQRLPKVQVLVLTLYAEDYVQEAIEAGSAGYLLKDSNSELIIMAVHQIHQGLSPIAPSITRQLINDFNSRGKYNSLSLTKRQEEILQFIAQGINNNEVGSQMFISASTVKREIRNIFDKLGVNDRAHAVSIAMKRRLISVAA